MIQNILCSIGGVEIYGIISIGIFFTFFTGVLVWACRLKKNYLQTMAGLPLAGEPAAPHSPETRQPENL